VYNGFEIMQLYRKSSVVMVAVALAACGGGGGGGGTTGGGGGSPSPAPNDPPVADAGPDQAVDEASRVTLAGSATDADGTIAGYSWTQTSGAAVTLSAADTATATFDAPALALGETASLSFELRVTDDDGADDSDAVTVTVSGVAGVNGPPTANAGDDRVVFATQTVSLDGTASSDPDEAVSGLDFGWEQTGGPAVTLTGADQAEAAFEAPDVASDTVLSFRLTVTDSDGASDTDAVELTVREAPAEVTVSGRVEFEFVPRGPIGTGLNYSGTEVRPIRGATVQAVAAADGTVLDATASSTAGEYSLTVPSLTDVFIRVRAELKRAGTPSWDVEVRDNTSNIGLPLGQRPLYVLDGAVFDSSVADAQRNLLAQTGWNATVRGYTEGRAAAPFSVLDIIYRAMDLVVQADPGAQFAPLDAFWSVNNRPTAGGTDINAGELGSSFYRGDLDSLFLLGAEDEDTEEFDTHVIAHEWGHYFEDTLSRSDSVGGRWSDDLELDARLAFGEGWGNAVAGMIMDDPVYFDTLRTDQSSSFSIDVDGSFNAPEGWFSAGSVQEILWDLFDDDNSEAADGLSLGFGGLYDVLVNQQRVTPAFTTLFSFTSALKDNNPAEAGGIDGLVSAQSVDPVADIWGSGETSDGGSQAVLPVYEELSLGATVDTCVTRTFETATGETGNKLGTFRYIRFEVASTGNYRIEVTTTNPPTAEPDEPEPFSDPDFFVRRSGQIIEVGGTGTRNAESLDLPSLPAGTYVIELFEAGFPNVYQFSSGSVDFTQDDMCFDVSLSQF